MLTTLLEKAERGERVAEFLRPQSQPDEGAAPKAQAITAVFDLPRMLGRAEGGTTYVEDRQGRTYVFDTTGFRNWVSEGGAGT